MGQLTYRNSFLAFAALYFSIWSAGSWFISADQGTIWITDQMTTSEIIISLMIILAVSIISLLILFSLAWATIKSFTGYTVTAGEIILYLLVVGIVSFLALSFLLPLILGAPLSLAGIDLASEPLSDFENNISIMVNIIVTALVAAWSSGIFYQQISKKRAAAEEPRANDQPAGRGDS